MSDFSVSNANPNLLPPDTTVNTNNNIGDIAAPDAIAVANDPSLNGSANPDVGAKLLVAMNDQNTHTNVQSNNQNDAISNYGGTPIARGYQITCSDDPRTEQQCRDATPPAAPPEPKPLAFTVPNISVAPGTYQGGPVGLGVGVNNGDRTAGFSQQDSRWGDKEYKWAPGVPLLGIGAQKGSWRDIGCTATAFTNGLRAVHPNSGLTPGNAADLDTKFWDTARNTRFTDLSGQGKQVNMRNIENSTNGVTGYQQGPKMEQIDPVAVNSKEGEELTDNIRRSLQEGDPVLVGFRNADGGQIRHSSLAVGYDKGQLQILDSETGKVMPMDKFLQAYGYTDAKYDYAYAMSAK
jgi:hypothetical protein